jgi:hypothetical protein
MLSKNVNAQEPSGLCSLPYEILDFIWKDLSPASSVVLMMACKQFAKIGKLRDTKPPPTDGLRYYWMLSKLASWMPRNLRLCGSCRMYRMRATEQYEESDWCKLWPQERWIEIPNGTMEEWLVEIFMCPLHYIHARSSAS